MSWNQGLCQQGFPWGWGGPAASTPLLLLTRMPVTSLVGPRWHPERVCDLPLAVASWQFCPNPHSTEHTEAQRG